MKRFFYVTLVLLLGVGLALSGCGSQPPAPADPGDQPAEQENQPAEQEGQYEAITIRLAHNSSDSPEDTYTYGATKFIELIEERSGGAVRVEFFPNAIYGTEREQFESVMMGDVEMVIMTSANIAEFCPTFNAIVLPFLFSSSQVAWAALDSDAGMAICQAMEGDCGVKGLAWAETGFRQFGTDVPIYQASDMKGLKVRSVENQINVAAYKAWGANPSPLPWSETLTGFQQGTIDGFDTPISIFYTQALYDLCDYCVVTNQFYNAQLYCCNLDWFNSLSQPLQELIQQCAKEGAQASRDFLKSKESEWLDMLESDFNMNVIRTEEIDMASFIEPVRYLYDQTAQELGGTYVQDLLDAVEAAQQ